MSLDLDGYVVLRAIGSQPGLFANLAVDVKKAALSLVGKQLRAKSSDLETLGDIRRALGEEQFGLLIDAMSDAQVKGLVGRFDKHHPDLKAATPKWRRQHLDALARGAVQPTPKPAPAKRKPAAKRAAKSKSEAGTGLFGKSMAAVRKRR